MADYNSTEYALSIRKPICHIEKLYNMLLNKDFLLDLPPDEFVIYKQRHDKETDCADYSWVSCYSNTDTNFKYTYLYYPYVVDKDTPLIMSYMYFFDENDHITFYYKNGNYIASSITLSKLSNEMWFNYMDLCI